MIVLKKVTKRFGSASALADVTLLIEPKECVCLVGGAGSGKSVLLSLLIAADTATSGSVEVDGVDLKVIPQPAMQLYRRRVGMMFQDKKLLPQRTAFENLAFPLEVTCSPDSLIRTRVPALLKYLGLMEKNRAFPRDLSHFEQAKLALARAIVHKPAILLADEPTAGLNAAESNAIIALLREIHAVGTTVITATRDPSLASALNERTVTLERGRIVADSKKAEEKPIAAESGSVAQHDEQAEERLAREKIIKDAQRKVKITSIGAL